MCIIYPDEGPCYACWAERLREGLSHPAEEAELDYGMIGPDGTLAAEPGLWLHVVRVAAIQADLALNHLLADTPVHRALPTNTIIQANTYLEIYEGKVALPHTAEWVSVPRNPQCLVCSRQQRASAAERTRGVPPLPARSGCGERRGAPHSQSGLAGVCTAMLSRARTPRSAAARDRPRP